MTKSLADVHAQLNIRRTPEEVRRSEDPYVQRFLELWFEKQ